MKGFKIFDKLNIKQPEKFESEDDWFEYFINDYIPEQGEENMFVFLELGMSPISYIMWKAVILGEWEKFRKVKKKWRDI